VVAVVQARAGSRRLPGKALADLAGRPLLWHVLTRARLIRGVDAVVLATTRAGADDALVELADALDVGAFRGAEDDVLDRVHRAARDDDADVVVRLTGDCPLLDPDVSSAVLARFLRPRLLGGGAARPDYASNVHPRRTWPDGLDTEVVSIEALAVAHVEATDAWDREHVTSYIRTGMFNRVNVTAVDRLGAEALRWTVDAPEDLAHVRALVAACGPEARFPALLAEERRRAGALDGAQPPDGGAPAARLDAEAGSGTTRTADPGSARGRDRD